MFWAGASFHKYDTLLKPSGSTGHVQRKEKKTFEKSLQWMALDPPCLSSVKNCARTATLQDNANNYNLLASHIWAATSSNTIEITTAHHAVIHKSTQL